MSSRELVVLGTASQAPTRYRNHNGYLLRWDREGLLFDPGEGTQRQFTFAGVAPSTITNICITHFHGDHCLGLPGMLQRLGLDGIAHPISLHYPASGQEYVDRLRHASIADERVDLRECPVTDATAPRDLGAFVLRAARLTHRVDAFGWRIDEPPGRRMIASRLDALGVRGPEVGRLQREGRIEIDGRWIELDQVSEHRPGQSFAFIMDTAWCDAALELADNVDLLVCESTFLARDERLAEAYRHLTADQAGRLARQAGARRLVLTHFSQRYTDDEEFRAEAAAHVADVHVARDLDRVPVPPRR
ncbi:MAG TPA: ribonuclease Z [Acidimicrobiales bacterium]|jgi:ribonuclease Z|nr:ribonuclease Z [Acidimicrobiales bacterium]